MNWKILSLLLIFPQILSAFPSKEEWDKKTDYQLPTSVAHTEKIPEYLSFLYEDSIMYSPVEILTSTRIDLHSLSVEQAKKAVISHIKQIHGSKTGSSVVFITGRGKHVNAKGERGTLFKEFPTWIEDKSITSFVKNVIPGLGIYEVIFDDAFTPPTELIKTLRVDLIKIAAQKLNPHYIYLLAIMHINGDRVDKDVKKAVELLREASKLQYAPAQCMLGFMISMGRGAMYDPEEAFACYNEAGKQDHIGALRNMATMYLTGEGVKQSQENAFQAYLKAATLGDIISANLVGASYYKGRGVEKNKEEALKWYRRSTQDGSPHAMTNLGAILISHSDAKDREEGFTWLTKAVEKGIAETQFWLGYAYINGLGTLQNPKEALKYFLKSAHQNCYPFSQDSALALSHIYRMGMEKHLKPNRELANYWLQEAANHGFAEAMLELAEYHKEEKFGFQKESTLILDLLTKAAKPGHPRTKYPQGHPLAQYKLYEIYRDGLMGVKKNPGLAGQNLKNFNAQGYSLEELLSHFFPNKIALTMPHDDGTDFILTRDQISKISQLLKHMDENPEMYPLPESISKATSSSNPS